MHKSQIFFYFLTAFILGAFFGSFFSAGDYFLFSMLAIGLILISLFWRKNWQLVIFGFLFIFFIFGLVRFQSFSSQNRILEEFSNRNVKVTLIGYIDSEVKDSGLVQNFIFKVKELRVPNYKFGVNEKTVVSARLYPQYYYGQNLKINNELEFPQNFEPGFDYRAYLSKEGVFTTMSFPKIELVDQIKKQSFLEKTKISLFKVIFKFKNNFERAISRSIAEPNAAFINGILLGSRENIPKDLKEDFSKTGITHVLAISGYNITIIASIISWFFLLFFRRGIAFYFSVAGIILFTILTGASASVSRAAVMGILILLASKSGRLYDPRNSIAVAGMIMIFLNPIVLRYDVGFQLSFLATIGILFVSPIIQRYFKKIPNFFDFRETFIATTSAQLMVLPLIIFHFHNFSLVSLPANILILPLIPYSMLLGFFSGLAGMILPVLGQIVGYGAYLITAIEIGLVKLFSRPGFASFNFIISWPWLVILYSALFYIIYRLKKVETKQQSKN